MGRRGTTDSGCEARSGPAISGRAIGLSSLVATGSGIGLFLSILEQAALAIRDKRAFTFFYCARTPGDLPCEARINELAALLDLTYRPLLSRPTLECG